MLVESLVNATLELQGFRVVKVTGDTSGLMVELGADGATHRGQLRPMGQFVGGAVGLCSGAGVEAHLLGVAGLATGGGEGN